MLPIHFPRNSIVLAVITYKCMKTQKKKKFPVLDSICVHSHNRAAMHRWLAERINIRKLSHSTTFSHSHVISACSGTSPQHQRYQDGQRNTARTNRYWPHCNTRPVDRVIPTLKNVTQLIPVGLFMTCKVFWHILPTPNSKIHHLTEFRILASTLTNIFCVRS